MDKELAEILGNFRVEKRYKHWYFEEENVDEVIDKLKEFFSKTRITNYDRRVIALSKH